MVSIWTCPEKMTKSSENKKHTKDYYFNAREKIYNRLAELPQGTIKERVISGRRYYYLQRREGKKVIHTYLGKEIPQAIKEQMQERTKWGEMIDMDRIP